MPAPPLRPNEALPTTASLVVAAAVAAVIGLAHVAFVLAAAGGPIGARLLAVLPIYFLAAFAAALIVFWTLRAALGRFLRLDLRAHAVLSLLTFLLAALFHYGESRGVARVLQEATVAGSGGSCPPAVPCTPLPEAGALERADSAVRREAAAHARLDAALFALLMRDADPEVRATLARRGDLPQGLLERMAGDPHPAVRQAVAASPRLSDEALSRLALDREAEVRLAVARNRGAPPTALAVLATSRSPELRLLVAEHPRASEPVLERLLDGSADEAERIARRRLGRSVP